MTRDEMLFLCGFLVTDDGFNGEYAAKHLAPRDLGDALTQQHYKGTVEERLQELALNPEVMRLAREAAARANTTAAAIAAQSLTIAGQPFTPDEIKECLRAAFDGDEATR